MTTKTVGIRLGVEGQSDVKRAFAEAGDAQENAYLRAQRGAERASIAAARLTADAERATASARAQASAAEGMAPSAVQQNIRAITGIDAASGPRSFANDRQWIALMAEEERAQAALTAKVAALRAEIDPLGAAQGRLAVRTAEVDALLARGAITTAEHAAATKLAKGAYAEAEHAISKLTDGAGLNRMQMMELTHVARSSFDAIAAGASPMRVLAMEGGRVYQALGTGEGGLGAGFKAVLGLLNPVVIGVGLVAGAMIIGAKAAEDYASAQAKARVALNYLGVTSGASLAVVNSIAESQAASAGVTVASARNMEVAFAKTGKIGVEFFSGLISVQRDYAAATGQTSEQATAALLKAFADPAKGAAELTDQLHFLDAATLRHIKDLVEQGDRTQAQTVLMGALKVATKNAADEGLTPLGKAMEGLKRSTSDVYNYIGSLIGRLTHELPAAARLAQLQSERAESVRAGGKGGTVLAGESAVSFRSTAQIDADIARVQGLAAADASAVQAKAQAARLKDASRDLATAYDGLAPKQAQIETIRNRQVQLRAALNDPQLLAATGKSRGDLAKAIATGDKEIAKLQKSTDHVDRHAQALQRDADSMAVNAAGQLALASAYLQSDSAALIAEARRKALTDATRKGADADARVTAQLKLSIAEQVAAGAKHAAELRDQAQEQAGVNQAIDAGTMSLDDAGRALKLQAALRPLLTAQSAAHAKGLLEEEARLKGVIAATRDWQAANDDAAAHYAALQRLDASKERLSDLMLEIKFAGDLTGALATQLAVRQALREAEKGGANSTVTTAAGISAWAEATARQQKSKADFIASTRAEQRNAGEMAAAELSTIGMSAAAHDAVIARLRTEQVLREHSVGLASEEGQSILAASDALALQNAKLQAVQASWQELTGSASQIVDDLGQALSPDQWGNWGEAGKSVLFDIAKEFEKLALLNPLKNFLTGSSLPTLSSVGGLLGGLFKGGGASVGTDANGAILNLGGSAFTSALTSGFKSGFSFPGFANGTDSAPGGMAWIAENGPELVNLPRGASVTPAPKTRALMASNDSAPLTFNITINADGADAAGLAAVKAELQNLRRELPSTIVSTVADAQRRRVIPRAA